MDLFEYQARDVFEKHGVPVLAGAVATTPAEARAAAEEMLGQVAIALGASEMLRERVDSLEIVPTRNRG